MFKLIKLILIFLIAVTADAEELQVNHALESTSDGKSNDDDEIADKCDDNDANLQKEHLNIELKNKFEIELFKMLNSKNEKKQFSFEMDHTQYIRKNAINKKQIAYLIDLIDNKRGKKFDTNYHNYKNQFYVGDHKELRSIIPENKKHKGLGDRLVALEDIWDTY